MRLTALAFVVATVVAAGATPAVPALAQDEGTVVGRPNLELSATENRFGPGERAIFEVFVSNNGDIDRGGPSELEERVTTARNVRLEIQDDRLPPALAEGLQVETSEIFAGSVPEGASGPFAFNVEISESVAPGTYEIPVEVTYDYTNFVRYGPNQAPEYGDSQRTQTAYFTVVVEDRPQFDIRTQNLTRVPAGDTATYRINVTNSGTSPATDARVQLSVANTSIFFGGPDNPQQRTSVFFRSVAPGETKTFTVTVGADRNTAPGTYLADAFVSYTNANGVQERSEAPDVRRVGRRRTDVRGQRRSQHSQGRRHRSRQRATGQHRHEQRHGGSRRDDR
ncbi:COG1361 S-layer family protein [Halorussus caseinilyticus]|uniref:COG1361 S-layer family protein n=1 Tax=Halorussus caseinilyticus TaxID=3034025 RepID=A0ABD5WLE7_9EURY